MIDPCEVLKADDFATIGPLTTAPKSEQGKSTPCNYDVQNSNPAGVLDVRVEFGPTFREWIELYAKVNGDVEEVDFEGHSSFSGCPTSDQGMACLRVIAVSAQYTMNIIVGQPGANESQLAAFSDQLAHRALGNLPPA
ncbi:hypothetical protein Lesp02_20540 [Lentzea sp. NBRC 105346]|nr:hypothetical protein Lesp02_20540 [Lentzea sp. NBRC 105346]